MSVSGYEAATVTARSMQKMVAYFSVRQEIASRSLFN